MNIGGERYVYPSLNYEHKLHCPNPHLLLCTVTYVFEKIRKIVLKIFKNFGFFGQAGHV